PSWAPPCCAQYYWAYVPTGAVQQRLREAFTRWGVPRRLRVDKGTRWGSWNDLPPALALWLIGLGIDVVWNDPRRPQQNGVVERSQGTGKRWAEPHTCSSVAELQRRLDEDDALQRERYPLPAGGSRWEVFAGLTHSGRPYAAAREAQQWGGGGGGGPPGGLRGAAAGGPPGQGVGVHPQPVCGRGACRQAGVRAVRPTAGAVADQRRPGPRAADQAGARDQRGDDP